MRLTPVIQEVANERSLHMLFSVVDSGLVWADPALDITPEIIQKFDAVRPAAAAARAEARGGGPRRPRRSPRPRPRHPSRAGAGAR